MDHEEGFANVLGKLEAIHDDVLGVREDLKEPISKIEDLHVDYKAAAAHLKTIAESINKYTTQALEGAIGKKQVSQTIYLVTVLVGAIFIILLIMRETKKDVKISANSFEMKEHTAE